ncbi:MAG: thioredoxin family protein [Planctomycetes bacterium]|nr:thioredoxin family protein [Planctomycetota bacterium]
MSKPEPRRRCSFTLAPDAQVAVQRFDALDADGEEAAAAALARDVQQAFDLAEREGKPLFLYWGAVWCPPCNQIKSTIFSQRAFIEKTKLFVPVYLDGDTESAQIWGERLDVWGYPTMLVLSPEGREVMRMPTGLQLEEFNKGVGTDLEV